MTVSCHKRRLAAGSRGHRKDGQVSRQGLDTACQGLFLRPVDKLRGNCGLLASLLWWLKSTRQNHLGNSIPQHAERVFLFGLSEVGRSMLTVGSIFPGCVLN